MIDSFYLTEPPRLIYDIPEWFDPENEACCIAATIYCVLKTLQGNKDESQN